DGFASMDAGRSEGSLLTRPLQFRGKYLFVNVDAPKGELRVEVLDQEGRVLAPFSGTNALPIQADRVLQKVTWKGTEVLSAVAGRPVRFRFTLRQGKLYAFWVSSTISGASQGYVAAGGPEYSGASDSA